MPYAAITYPVKPGFEAEITELFSNFQRVATPVLTDDSGAEVGRLLGTAVFINDGVMVRVIHYEGDFAAVGKHMGNHPGVHAIEAKLQPYLAYQRDTSSPEKFREHFLRSLMRKISAVGSCADHDNAGEATTSVAS